VNPRAIVMSLPLLRRVWRILPAPLRLPLLVIGAVIAIAQRLSGRRQVA
jgi:hypothetical protein